MSTGLIDKYGKDIKIDDELLDEDGVVWQVCWDERRQIFYLLRADGEGISWMDTFLSNWQVV